MDPHSSKHDQAHDWLRQRLERLEKDPDMLASMPLGDVQEALSDEGLVAVERLKARFAVPDSPDQTPARTDRPALVPPRRRRLWPVVTLAATVLVVISGLWLVGPASRSETERLVAIGEYEGDVAQALDRPDAVKGESQGLTELEAGWTDLQQARRHLLGVSLGYDDAKVRRAIEHLEAAYRAGKSAQGGSIENKAPDAVPSQGLVAFLLGQAHLALENVERARFWLQTATGYDDEPWHTVARALLDRLDSPG